MASKYRAKSIVIDGHKFPSLKEGRQYSELKLLERAGKIRGLELQPIFPISINGVKCFVYKADFAYFEGEDRIVQDCKGFKTPMYKLKKRCVEAFYHIKIRET